MGKKVIFTNVLTIFFLQFVTIINGFLVPKIFLSLFGSEANGLVTSINQFLNYVTLLEGGLNGVVLASLYKPLRENDEEKISGIFNATQHFFRQIGLIYIAYTCIIAVVYPLFVKSEFRYFYVLCLVLVLGLNLFTQYFFSMTNQILIKASQKVYIISGTQALVLILNMVLIIACSKIFPDLIFIKLVSAVVLFLQPIVFSLYVKKHFKLSKKVKRDDDAIKQRWSGFGHTLAYFINTNVSVLLLTAFSSLTIISVYSVYLMITNAIRNLVVAVAGALVPSLGNAMAKGDVEESRRAFDIYEFGMCFLTVLLFTCGIVLVVPFVGVYTANITDANYIQPVFGFLLMLAEGIYCFREPYINTAYAAGHFKQTAKYAYIEVALNVVISVVLVQFFDLVGVTIGFLTAVVFRMVAHVFYLKKNILYRPVRKCVKMVVSLFVPATVSIVLCKAVLPLEHITNFIDWAVNAVIVGVIALVVLAVPSLFFYRTEIKKIIGKRL